MSSYVSNYKKSFTIYQITRYLLQREVIKQDGVALILNASKIRNVILHGGKVKNIEEGMGDKILALIEELTKISDKNENNLNTLTDGAK